MHKFEGVWIIHVCDFEGVHIDVQKAICLHLHHIALGCCLVTFDFLGKVVILFCAQETRPQLLQLGFSLLIQSS